MTPPSSASPKPPQDGAPRSAPPWSSYALVALLTASVTGAGALLLNRPQPEPIVIHPPPTQAPTPTPGPTDTHAPIVVFVSGAVLQPDVYTLAADARVVDALNAAGGFVEDADVNAVNQAEALWDGVQVHVPAMDEVVPAPPTGVSGATRSGDAVIDAPGKVDVNSATLDELLDLPNIGEVRAKAIIEGRPYETIEELERVEGIGAKTLEKLRDLVDVR